MTEKPKQRGVGIHYVTQNLTVESLSTWLFENVGDVKALDKGCVACSRNLGVYFNFSSEAQKIRISLWSGLSEKDAWVVINLWAVRVSRGTQCSLTTESVDCYEEDPVAGGYRLVHHSLVAGKVLENVVTFVAPKKNRPERTH